MLAELNIHTVAYYIHRGQEVLRDLVSVQRQEFLNWLATAKVLPTTACPFLVLLKKMRLPFCCIPPAPHSAPRSCRSPRAIL
jgi:hypothetical protein